MGNDMRYRKKKFAATAAIALALAAGSAGFCFAAYGPGMSEAEMEYYGITESKAEESEPVTSETTAAQISENEESAFSGTFDVNRFVLPEDAAVLVVVEGTGGSNCMVYAYEYEERKSGGESWALRLSTPGYLGLNGMSNHRTEGDKTTPIGLFQLNTPFGQAAPLSGFPENYIQVTESYVWTDTTNRLVDNAAERGEHVGTVGYAKYYDYVLDAGYNKNAVSKKGSALFLHCHGPGRTDTSGCVSVEKSQMAAIMRLYGTYGDGRCYIAQAPKGTFDLIYDSYGVNNGLSPDGDFEQ